ncbi:uncharacterized protein UV8b_03335 [Ustilaginoidea virens]|uniref:Uncharacterized protein n=1 Tax=Ustilaginoidea virens TaxID=1159556 RepID=A0A1B5L7P8_USTVR|nr:uncharacterized protein UV8b_03335 [Ustilaginoidea virens]QUC19094.1 hypothetical protein UV8b_03335 [Ustilaginoidea virens]GAO19285.1 hypothetical protein UVI_02063410 [Ustilaginoidea virens]
MPPETTIDKTKEPYSDASSSYWPEGWGWERYSHPDEDATSLPEEEQEKIRNGFRHVLGNDGFNKMMDYLFEKEMAHQKKEQDLANALPPEYKAPDFLRHWRLRCSSGPWGFYAFRTALYGQDDKWEEFKTRLDRLVNIPFDHVVQAHRGHEYEEVAEGRRTFTIHWIEDEQLAGANADSLRKRYSALRQDKEAKGALDLGMFLCASPEAVESVLSPNQDDLPTTDSLAFRDEAPFLLAVMMEESTNPHGDEEPYDPHDPHHEANWYKSVFKVPIELIANEFWKTIEDPVMGLARITRNVRGSTELGGELPKIIPLDEPYEYWWGAGPTPRSIKRRRMG